MLADESAIESSLIGNETYRDNQNPKLVDHANGVFVDESAVTLSSFKLTDPRNGMLVDESAVTPSTFKLTDPMNGVYADESAVTN